VREPDSAARFAITAVSHTIGAYWCACLALNPGQVNKRSADFLAADLVSTIAQELVRCEPAAGGGGNSAASWPKDGSFLADQ
jgi:hypothetical protein